MTYSPFLRTWVVVPTGERYIFGSASEVKQAFKYGTQAQEQFNFQQLQVQTRDGTVKKTVEHPFLRESITDPNVKFNR